MFSRTAKCSDLHGDLLACTVSSLGLGQHARGFLTVLHLRRKDSVVPTDAEFLCQDPAWHRVCQCTHTVACVENSDSYVSEQIVACSEGREQGWAITVPQGSVSGYESTYLKSPLYHILEVSHLHFPSFKARLTFGSRLEGCLSIAVPLGRGRQRDWQSDR